jgi:hypothetical protein
MIEWIEYIQNITEERSALVGLLKGGDRVVRFQGNHMGRH